MRASTTSRLQIAGLLLVAVLAFIPTLLLQMPAAHAWQWFAADVQGELHAPGGTIRDGRAMALVVDGYQLDNPRWNLDGWALLRGRIAYTIHANLGDARAGTEVDTGLLGGPVRFRNLRVDGHAGTLLARVHVTLPVAVGGNLDGFFERLSIDRDGRLRDVRGVVNWNAGTLSALGETLALGSYAISLVGEETLIRGTLTDTEAVLRLEGNLELDPASGQVVGNVLLQAREEASDTVVEALRMIGLSEPHAENRFRIEGVLDDPASFQGTWL